RGPLPRRRSGEGLRGPQRAGEPASGVVSIEAWAAGYFEGEGSVHIRVVSSGRRVKQRRTGNPTVQIASTDRDLLDTVSHRWGGSVLRTRINNPKARPAWRWF